MAGAMTEEQRAVSSMRAITISREYGSGGGEIAARLAQRLGWRLVDHEVVVRVAQELHVSEAEAAEHDERAEGLVETLLRNMQLMGPVMPAYSSSTSLWGNEPQLYREALRRVVEAAAHAGHVVIVGRAGQVLLADHRDVLHIRVVAPLPQRIAYVARREGFAEPEARSRILLKDRDRERYLQMQHHRQPNDPELYDLVINTGVLDLESAVDLICLALQRKAQRIAVPVAELGAVAGLAPYAGTPADLRPPEDAPEHAE